MEFQNNNSVCLIIMHYLWFEAFEHKLCGLHHPLVLFCVGATTGGSLDGSVEHGKSGTRANGVDKVNLASGKDLRNRNIALINSVHGNLGK